MSIGSLADTVRADSTKKSGVPNVPGLDVMTFSPDRNANLLRKNSTLLIRCPTNVGIGLVISSPTYLSAYVNCLTVNVVVAVRCITSGMLVSDAAIPGFAHSDQEPDPSRLFSPSKRK